MKIEKLEVEYFMCFGPKFVLEFPSEFNIMVVGYWANQPHRSNWSGKSTLLETIKFLLYGETRSKYLKEIPNDNFSKEARVSGIINIDGKRFKITRTATKSSSSLEVKGWSSQDKKVLQAKLNRKLGYAYSDFISTCFFNQGDIHQFMEAKSSEKLSLLERWMEMLGWEEHEFIVKEKKKFVEEKLRQITEVVSKKEMLRVRFKEVKEDIVETEERIIVLKDKEEKVTEQIEELREEQKDYKDKATLLKKKKELDNKLFTIGTVGTLDSRIGKTKQELKEKRESAQEDKEHVKGLPALQKKKGNLDYDVKTQESVLETRKNLLEGIKEKLDSIGTAHHCPIDGQDCVRVREIKKYRQKQEKKLEKVKSRNKYLQKKLDVLFGKFSKLELAITEMIQTIRRIEKTELEIDKLKERLKWLKQQRIISDETEVELKKIEKYGSNKNRMKHQKKLEELKSRSSEIKVDIEERTENLGGLRQESKQLSKSLQNIKAKEKRADLYSKRKEVLAFCGYMFGRNGIRSSQLKSRIESIEQETNEILDELDCKLQIEIHTDRELSSWEPFCVFCGREFPRGYSKHKCDKCKNERQKKRKEEFDIKILNQGKTRSFNQESGGVKVLVSLAIRLSLVKLRQRITGKSIDLLFLDEIYGMLDSVNREQVYMLLLDYANKKLGFKQIFQITHVNDGFNEGSRIEVIKKRKYSEVKWA